MILWSTVVSAPQKPGRRSPRLRRAPPSGVVPVEVDVAQVATLWRRLFISGSPDRRRPRCSSSRVSGTIGMLLPGLMVCGSAIQAASEPRVVRNRPAAMVRRLPTWVRSGPVVPAAGVPRTVWQAAHGLRQERLLARRGLLLRPAAAAAFRCRVRPAVETSGVSAITSNAMWACCRPQNSAHWPR